MGNEFLSVLYDMDYSFTNHTLIFEVFSQNIEVLSKNIEVLSKNIGVFSQNIMEFVSLYWFQSFTTFTMIFILLYINHLERRLAFIENCFGQHLENHVEDNEDIDENFEKLNEILNNILNENKCKAISNLHFEKRRGLIQCENYAESGRDFCEIHDERDVLSSEDEEEDSEYVYNSASSEEVSL